jgi:hypothetical protein
MGVALLLRIAPARPPADVVPGESEDSGADALPSLKKYEKSLRATVEAHANPGKETERVSAGVVVNVELGLFYLDQWRLDDAEQLFNRLASNADIPRYRHLGRLGQAIVLALQNRPRESNELFLALFVEKPAAPRRFDGLIFLNAHPKLRQWVATALEYNAANTAISPYPAELDFLRKPSPLTAKPGGEKKP